MNTATTARTNTACFYERLEFRESGVVPAGLNQTAKDDSFELEHLVKLQSDSERLVLGGYSFGDFVVRHYSVKHASKVDTILLVDAAPVNWIQSESSRRRVGISWWIRSPILLSGN